MNAALAVSLPDGKYLLITDADDALSWYRDDQLGWAVGLYPSDDLPDATAFDQTPDGSTESLVRTIDVVMGKPEATDRA
jgi:hypothetical protein